MSTTALAVVVVGSRAPLRLFSFTRGCAVDSASALETCCSAVGSTPAFVNDTCGCPFSAVFVPNDTQNFFACANKINAEAGCNSPQPSVATRPPLPWNAAVVVLGLALLPVYAAVIGEQEANVSRGWSGVRIAAELEVGSESLSSVQSKSADSVSAQPVLEERCDLSGRERKLEKDDGRRQ
ncbi:hypothetical protein B0H14DRAFT_2561312 [Mycena olivaceomarginata]|nr:hypothetical protein B0H14DRAFT_2561312 [Mycena olivaceomarginata]